MPFYIFRASAGSGKTETLVREYLKLVLKNPEKFRHILAITFTNKTAAEMKERIILSLKKLSQGQVPELERELQSHLPGLNIRRASREVLNRLLHEYSDFSVTTIDAFIFRVIRSFALELGLPLNFNVDIRYERMFAYIGDRLLAQVGEDQALTDSVLGWVESRLASERSWDIEPYVRQLQQEMMKETSREWLQAVAAWEPDVLQRFLATCNSLRAEVLDRWRQLGQSGLRLIADGKIAAEDFARNAGSALLFFEKIARLTPEKFKELKLYSGLLENRWLKAKAARASGENLQRLLAGALGRVRQEIILLHGERHVDALTADAVLRLAYLLGLVRRLHDRLEDYKREYNAVPIFEFNLKVNEIVRRTDVPFIFAVFGERYDHYLLDEFQDTSKLQWQNILPLLENAQGYGHFSMAVGDGKQAIYRWRGGDAALMDRPLPFSSQPLHLESNYRSRERIVHFNNLLFSFLREKLSGEHPGLSAVYRDAEQTPEAGEGGFVSLEFIPAAAAENAEARREQVGQRLLEIIFRLQADGFRLPDIAVLVRENAEGEELADRLLAARIDVVTADSLRLASAPLTRFLLAALRLLLQPGDRLSRAVLIYYWTLYGRGAADGDEVLLVKPQPGRETVLAPELESFFKRRDFLCRLPVYELTEELIRIFRLDHIPALTSAGILESFLEAVNVFNQGGSDDIASFLDWWELNAEVLALNMSESGEALRLMTIHKAKGLQFPAVIVPYADWQQKTEDALWLRPSPEWLAGSRPADMFLVPGSKELAATRFAAAFAEEKANLLLDNLNLLYVACTRASERLYLISGRRNELAPLVEEFAATALERQNGGEVFGLGQEQKRSPPQVKTAAGEYLKENELVSYDWRQRVAVRRQSAEFWRFDPGYRAERIRWGVLVHRLLARVRLSQDAPAAVEAALAEGEIEDSEREPLLRKLTEVLENPRLRDWFSPAGETLCEFPLITPQGVLRPDRVRYLGEDTEVIDFKTGKPEPSHVSQMRLYLRALRGMGRMRARGYLVYLDEGRVEQVGPDKE